MLLNETADIVTHLMDNCCGRDEYMDFVMPILPRTFFVAFKQPELANDVFFSQLRPNTWMAVLGVLVLFQIVMILVGNSSQKSKSWTNLDTISWPLFALAQKSHEPEPNCRVQRFLFITVFFFCLITFNHFAANIISSLQTAKSIKDLKELVNDNKDMILLFPTNEDGPWMQRLRQSEGTHVKRIVERSDEYHIKQSLNCWISCSS